MALAGGAFALVVAAAGTVVADLGQGHDVQGVVELAVTGAGEPVAHDVAGGHLDRRHAAEGGEGCRLPEPADRAGAGQDLGGHHVTDTEQPGEGAARGRDGVAECLRGFGDAAIQPA